MSDSVKKYFCPRLIDYIIFVGPKAKNLTEGNFHGEQGTHHKVPHLLKRYPLVDHKDFSLPPDVVIFCQPEGCEKIEAAKDAYNNPSQITNSFVFLLTEKDTSRVRYGICLNFYRSLQKCPQQTSCSVVRNSDQDVNNNTTTAEKSSVKSGPAFSNEFEINLKNDSVAENIGTANKNSDIFILETEHLNKKDISKHHGINRKECHIGQKLAKGGRKHKHSQLKQKSTITFALNSICIISHHPFFSTFRECLFVLKKIIESCDTRNLKFVNSNDTTFCECSSQLGRDVKQQKKTTYNFIHSHLCPYSNIVWSLMTMADLDQTYVPRALEDVIEIESWIFRLLNIPTPVPDKTRIEVELLPYSTKPPLIFALPDHTRFSLIDFPLHLPLELLGVQTCLQVLTCILLENKVALQSKDYNALSMSVMAFVAMIYPLDYMFPVIPLLPSCMSSAEQLLLAPTPFIIGFPASFFKFKSNFKLPNDVWIVDLDSNKIRKPPACEDLPPLPEHEGAILSRELQRILDSIAGLGPNVPEATLSNLVKNQNSIVQPQPRILQQTDSVPSSPSKRRLSMAVAGSIIQIAATRLSGSITNASSRSQSPNSSSRSSLAVPQNNTNIDNLTICDSDAADVATRISMVKFFNSSRVLANFTEHTRTIRLYPRPVVSFQRSSFIQSRHKPSLFLIKLVETQAVEYLAEWALSPTNVAFLRVQTGVTDVASVGDKPKWFSNHLKPLKFNVWNEQKQPFFEKLETVCNVLSSLGGYSNYQESGEVDGNEIAKGIDRSENYVKITETDDHSSYLSSKDESPCYSSHDEDVSETSDVGPKVRQEKFFAFTEKHEDQLNYSSDTESLTSDEDCSVLQSTPMYYQHDVANYPPIRCDVTAIYHPPEALVFFDEKETNRNMFSTYVNEVDAKVTQNQPGSSQIVDSSDDESVSDEEAYHEEFDIDKEVKLFEEPIGISENVANSLIQLKEEAMTKSQNSLEIVSEDGLSVKSGDRRSSIEPEMRLPAGSSAKETVSLIYESQKNLVSKSMAKFFDRAASINESKGSQQSNESENSKKSETVSSFLNRFTSEAKGAVKEAKAAIDASKSAIKSTPLVADAGKNKFLKNIGEMFEDKKSTTEKNIEASNKVGAENVIQQPRSESRSIIGGWLGSKATNFASRMRDRSRPLSPYPPGHKLVQKSNLIKHSDSSHSPERSQPIRTTSSDSENQQFLKEIADTVMKGDNIGWMKLTKVKKLMEDENYRDFILSKLNKNFEQKVRPDDKVEDIQISKKVWQSMLRLCLAIINGLEQSYMHNKLVGMASVFALLEIAHTHFFTQIESIEGNKKELPCQAVQRMTINTVQKQSQKDESSLGDTITSLNINSKELMNKEKKELNKDFVMNLNSKTKPDQEQNDISKKSGLTLASSKLMLKLDENCLSDGVSLSNIDQTRYYLYEGMLGKERSLLWDQLQFWEEAFLDAVSHEREMTGMDQGMTEMLERYLMMRDIDKKRLEQEEDRLLSTLLHNMIAFMIMLQVDKGSIKQKIRRLLGKCHISLVNSTEINQLLDRIDSIEGNHIDLKPMASKQSKRQTFAIHEGTDPSGEVIFMEVRADGIVLRRMNGTVIERWWYERLVNMTYSPKNKVICFWHKFTNQISLNKFYTKKCSELYNCIKESMQIAAANYGSSRVCSELGGEFPVFDEKSGEGGILQVCMEGVGLLFANSRNFIKLENIRKCTQKGGIFILEELSPKDRRLTQRLFRSQMADQICYAVLCVFSYVAAGQNKSAISADK